MAPLPRRMSDISNELAASLRNARVHPACKAIWAKGRAAGRGDTFIGLINMINWEFYLAPCFGVDPKDAAKVTSNESIDFLQLPDILKKIATGNFDGSTYVKANSTSSENATMVEIQKKNLDAIYGKTGVCYVKLDPDKGFDGFSHRSMHRWCMGVLDVESFWQTALGFAIQKDSVGYDLRFASTLNERLGQAGASPFVEREKARNDHEPRDLPKEWALFVEYVLAGELKLAITRQDDKFDRIKSRGEDQTTKLSRFTMPEPSERGNHLV